jgi:AAT family amino acid transporter
MVVMFFTWLFLRRRESEQSAGSASEPLLSDPEMEVDSGSPRHLNRDKTLKYHDLVDIDTVDLVRDEYDEEEDIEEDEVMSRLSGKMKLLWTFYYWFV